MKEFENQISFFDKTQPLKITNQIRLIELFAGIGSQAKALQNLNANFETYRICEFDKFAIKSYNAVHNTNFETSDITQLTGNDLGIVDTDKYTYILTYSFPCTDLSLAGKRAGMSKNGGTKSALLWEVERLLQETENLPQILVMENVPQVHSKKNRNDFENWLKFLQDLGYSNYFQDLNAKNFGVPQNRNRCFMVSCLGDYYYTFPQTIPLTKKLKDVLETNVEEKFYLSQKGCEYVYKRVGKYTQILNSESEFAVSTITAKGNTNWTGNFIENCNPKLLFNIYGENTGTGFAGNVWDKESLSPTLTSMQGGNRQPFITEEPLAYDEQNNYIRKDGTVGTLTTDGSSPKHNNRIVEPKIIREKPLDKENWHNLAREVLSVNGICRTITTQCNNNLTKIKEPISYRIRKLTPKECWRLMGFSDTDFEKAQAVNSNAQLYKQAGNSIVVDVLMAVFKQLL